MIIGWNRIINSSRQQDKESIFTGWKLFHFTVQFFFLLSVLQNCKASAASATVLFKNLSWRTFTLAWCNVIWLKQCCIVLHHAVEFSIRIGQKVLIHFPESSVCKTNLVSINSVIHDRYLIKPHTHELKNIKLLLWRHFLWIFWTLTCAVMGNESPSACFVTGRIHARV